MTVLDAFLAVAKALAPLEPLIVDLLGFAADAFRANGNTAIAQRIESILPAKSQSEATAERLEAEMKAGGR